MIPFYILLLLSVVFRTAGLVGIRRFATLTDSVIPAVAVMFLATGVTHFTGMKNDYLAMLPPPVPRELWVIYLTGVLEIAGAIGLLIPSAQKVAGYGLALLLFAMFPANLYAAFHEIPFRENPPTTLWLRLPVQAVFVTLLVWISSTSRRPHLTPPSY
jgi:uncharacterized membrane protein